MEALIQELPELITYLASGFAFVVGFYFLIDRRFDFFSEIGFTVMLVVGFVCVNFLQFLPAPFVIENIYLRNVLVCSSSLIIGLTVAFIRNFIGARANKVVIKTGRRKTSSAFFWYDRLDANDKPIWLRLVNYEQKYILEGVLLSLDEAQENPYLLLGYCKRYNLNGGLLDSQYSEDCRVQCIVHADTFQEIFLLYDQESSMPIKLTVGEDNGANP